MKASILLIIFWITSFGPVYAQDSTEYSFQQLQETIAEILSQNNEEVNLDQLTDYLYQLTSSPVKINWMDDTEIRRLFWLTDFQITNLIHYIKTFGFIRSVYELPNVAGFTERDAKLLAPFLSFEVAGKQKGYNDYFRFPKQMILLRTHKILEEQAGYKPENSSRFVGGPLSFYSRYHIYNDNFSAGITGEKDAGEEFFTGSNRNGFDFYSFHFQANNLGFIKTMVLGDYKLNFGNGLITGSAFNLGKMPSVISSGYQNMGVTRYTATDENNFFRGIACTFVRKKNELSLFYSNHTMDANSAMRDSANNNVLEATTLQTSGLHTIYSEISDEDAIRNKVFGAHLKLQSTHSEIGFTALYNNFSATINPTYEPYNADYFRGTTNYNLGANYRFRIGNIMGFGEEAYSKSNSFASLNGVQAHPFSGMLLNIIYRNYGNKYQALFGNAFGENTRNQNEMGLYFGMQCNLIKYVSFTGYADFYRFPHLRYEVDMPSEGEEYMGQFTVTPNPYFQFYAQYRIKYKEINEVVEGSPKNTLVTASTEHIRLGLNYKVSTNLTVQNRLEYSQYKKDEKTASEGYFISQDIDYKLPVIPVRLYSRYALFDIGAYDSRIYAYESDILYTFSIPSFYNKGYRFCLMAKFSSSSKMDFWIKYAITQYADRETISSGLYQINGNQKSEVRIQLLYRIN
jgi:hypothetical protein